MLDIRERAGGGYEIETERITDWFFKRRRTFTARGIVLSGGVLGTVPLLLKCRERGSLARLSAALGTFVRTNSEALVGATSRRDDVDYSRGIAIASGFWPEPATHVEMVRYGRGQDFMSLLCTVLVDGGPPWPRPLRLAGGGRAPSAGVSAAAAIRLAGPARRASCWSCNRCPTT